MQLIEDFSPNIFYRTTILQNTKVQHLGKKLARNIAK